MALIGYNVKMGSKNVKCRVADQDKKPDGMWCTLRDTLKHAFGSLSKAAVLRSSQWLLIFFPSVFFICVAVLTLLAPQLFIAAIASFFFFLGIAAFVLAWKLTQLKTRLDSLAKNFEARIYLQGVMPREFRQEQEITEKKIIVH